MGPSLDPNAPQAEALDRLTRLQALTASLSEAVTSEQVADAILSHALAVLGAGAGVIYRLGDDRNEFTCLRTAGYPEEAVGPWRCLPVSARAPLSDAVRDRRPVLLANLAEREARYPETARVPGVPAEGALAALPLVVRGKAIGGLGLRFPAGRTFTEQDRAFLLTVAGLSAQALERARLFDTERAARERAERAEDASRESEERFARFMQHLPGLAWIKDERGRYVYANDAAVSAFGKPRAEVYGRTDEEVFPPATAAQFLENDRKALAGGGTGVRLVETLEHGDGVLHHSLVSKFPIPGPAGAAALVGGMAIDITEERRTRAVLEESEERFRATFEQAAVGIGHVGLDGRWLRVNRKLCDIVGYRPDELAARTFQDITHPDDLEADLAYVRRLLAGEIDTYSMEKRYFRKDGSPVWINLTVSLVRTPGGRPKYFISVVEDVTRTKRVREALRESEARLRTLADSIPQLAWTARPDGHVEWYNRRWHEYTGTTPEQVAGWGWQAVHDPGELPRVLARWEESLASGEPFDMVFPLKGKDGRFRPFLTRVVPLRGVDGRVIQWFGTNTDVSEIKEMEARLREANRHKDEFLAMLAHELRNPLAPLRNGLQVLKSARADREAIEQARAMMDRQVKHMARIVDDLLDVSRVMRGRVELRPERLGLGGFVRTALEDHRPAFDAAGLSPGADLPELPVWVNADPTRLTQVLDNLLQNAAKFTDRGGTVWVRVRADGGRNQAVLSVRDSGVGIEPGLLPHLFDPFRQADRSLDRSKGGLGLGLSLVKGLVELHGGTVEARSEGRGRGAEFVVRLPLLPEPAAVTEMPAAPRRAATRLRVLVVEDNRDAADSLRMLLQLYGYEVTVAYTGPGGVEAAKEWRPDVVLCDIGLPGLDGYGVVRELRRNPATARARMIAVSGYGRDEDREKSQQAGFDAHLTKPADPDKLQELLTRPA